MKKFWSALLLMMLVLSMIFGVANAEEVSQITKKSDENGVHVEIPYTMTVDKTGKSVTKQGSIAENRVSPSADYAIQYNAIFDTTGGNLVYGYRIVGMYGAKPTRATITIAPHISTTRNGSYAQYGSRTFNVTSFNLNKVETTTENLYGTHYWRIKIDARTYWSDAIGYEQNLFPDYTLLINTKGVEYPTYTDPQSGIRLWEPPTNLSVNQRSADWNYRQNFKDYYDYSFGTPKYFTWDDTHIHHMQPLKYGGLDVVYNLIPVWKTGAIPQNGIISHTVLNNWWTHY
ncbi:hypothetical protein [Paenibacillus chitinolyticus]|uniref:hypothetical protein n=1 Tax=Paenibacillus chitinolyticus TaxID=79263 RepID=UPI003CFE1405